MLNNNKLLQAGCKRRTKATLKPFVGRFFTFHRIETKIACYTISHKYSPQFFFFFAHISKFCIKSYLGSSESVSPLG